jgi:flagellum-specific peptidoglycan hydrolase FlgJ
MTKSEFIVSIAENAKIVCKERSYGYAQYATCVAQACCESAYGQSAIMSKANAYFGIKANKNWVNKGKYGGKVYNSKTKECYDGKNYTTITGCFRAYNSLTDSVRDYFDLLGGKRYAASLKAQSVEECITIIKNGGYATSPTYIQTILKFYNTVKSQIDKIWGGVVDVAPKAKKTNKTDLDVIVDEVVRGLWGNGGERKIRLTRACYDYKTVQSEVNRRFGK